MLGIAKQRLERAQSEDLVHELAKQHVALAQAERRALFGEQLADERADLALGARPVGLRQRLEVQPVQELLVNVALSSTYCARGATDARRAGRARRGDWAVLKLLGSSWDHHIDAMRSRFSRPFFAAGAAGASVADGSTTRRVKCLNCSAISESPLSASGTPELSAVDTVL